jgi:hypothetical protein
MEDYYEFQSVTESFYEQIDDKSQILMDEHLKEVLKNLQSNKSDSITNESIERSSSELYKEASKHNIYDDAQTRHFCNFLSTASLFASLELRDKLLRIPEIVTNIRELSDTIINEIKEFADIAFVFDEIVSSFVRMVLETQRNTTMSLPYLENSATYIGVYSDALSLNQSQLSRSDKSDIEKALNRMLAGLENLNKNVKKFENKSIDVEKRIETLKNKIIDKINVTESRISFSKLLPRICGASGAIGGAAVIESAISSAAFGGAGALAISGVSLPPLGAMLMGILIGGTALSGIVYLVKKLWAKHQYKALAYLNELLKKLDQLNSSNLVFTGLIVKASSSAESLSVNLNELKTNACNGSPRFRKANADICKRSIASTKAVIKSIKEIDNMDLNQWINGPRHLKK